MVDGDEEIGHAAVEGKEGGRRADFSIRIAGRIIPVQLSGQE